MRAERSLLRNIVALAALLLVCFAAAGLGSLATTPNIDPWYRALAKPWWTPPESAFPVVWPVLYAMMAFAAWLVWRHGRERAPVRAALFAFAVQLAVNVSWSWAFFAARSPSSGLAVIAVLLAAIVWTIRRFARVDRAASLLLVPYILWVAYASALNLAIVLMNG